MTAPSSEFISPPFDDQPMTLEDATTRVESWLKVLTDPDGVTELRGLNCKTAGYRRPHEECGFYDAANLYQLAWRAMTYSKITGGNIYLTMNPVVKDLLARRANRVDVASKGDATSDKDILRRRFILIDIDPTRTTGVSASKEEKAAALALVILVREYLKSLGWPEPIFADSGNGYHLLFRVDLPAEDRFEGATDRDKRGIVQRILKALAKKHDNDKATVDTSVFNASRIVAFYGTVKRKGDHTPDRPHRRSRIIEIPPDIQAVPIELLNALAAEAPPIDSRPPPAGGAPPAPGAAYVDPGDWEPITAKLLQRITKYVLRIDPAVAGQKGHNQTFHVACVLMHKWALTVADAMPIFEEWNAGCQPPWDSRDLEKKLADANATEGPRGELRKKKTKPSRSKPKPPPPETTVVDDPNDERLKVEGADEAAIVTELQQQAQPQQYCLVNYTGDGEDKVPLTIKDMVTRALEICGDSPPRRMGTALFAHEKGSETIGWLLKPAAFFGYIGARSALPPRISEAQGYHTKAELFEEMRRSAPEVLAVEMYPHEPPMPGHYYIRQSPPPGDGSLMRQLLDKYSPASDIDRDLILAMFMTAIWGGPGGSRPAFGITSDAGRGVGKTTLIQQMAQLVGGVMEFSADEDPEQVKQRLLSAEGLSKRIGLLDNIKRRCYSNAETEALITAPTISGKRMYVGEGSRPNNLLWAITMNGGSYSTDLAQRSVFIKLNKPTHSGGWADETRAFIDDNRMGLIGDLIGLLRGPQTALPHNSRWGSWEREVLSRVPEPADAQRTILERQGVADVEIEESDLIEDYFRNKLRDLTYDAEREIVHIPAIVACWWLSKALNDKFTTTGSTRSINQRIGEGKITKLKINKCTTYGRGFLWWGEDADPGGNVRYDVEQRITMAGQRDGSGGFGRNGGSF